MTYTRKHQYYKMLFKIIQLDDIAKGLDEDGKEEMKGLTAEALEYLTGDDTALLKENEKEQPDKETN